MKYIIITIWVKRFCLLAKAFRARKLSAKIHTVYMTVYTDTINALIN